MIAMVAQVMKLINPGGLAYDSLLLSAGIAMQFALAFYLEWLSTIGGAGKVRAAQKEVAPVRAPFGISAVARVNR